MQQKLFLMLLTSLFLIIDSSNESNDKCYFINQESKETWKLMWQDNFQSEDYLKENWTFEQESCVGVPSNQVSCTVKDNVKLQDGSLVMSVKEEIYDQKNFTVAMIRTHRMFGYGRFEARAALSVDKDIWSIWYTGTERVNDGYFMMHRFENKSKSYQAAAIPNNFIYKTPKFNINYNSFHLYGMEWSEREVKFFVDQHYSEPILLNATRMIKAEQNIRLWFGVMIDDNEPLADKHSWKCPVWIVDYIRVYERVSNLNPGKKVEMCKAQNDVDKSSRKQRELVNSFCGIKTQSNQNQWKLFFSNINTIVYVAFGIATLFFIAFIVRLRYRINKMKQPKAPVSRNSPPEIELENQYEAIKYEDMKKTSDEVHNYLSIANE